MKLKNILTLAITVLLLACDNELNINSEWSDITVVYGLLDPTQDTNYIRIERGYLGPEPANSSFDKSDSLYYEDDEIVVTLYWYNIVNGSRGEEQGREILSPDFNIKDLNDNGPFTTEGYRIYPVISPDIPVSSEYEYELVIDKNDGGPQVTATTRVLETFEFRRPTNIGGVYEFQGLLSWRTARGSNTYLFQPRFYFYYNEFNLLTKQSEQKEIFYQYRDVDRKNSGDYEIRLDDDAFFGAIAGRVEDNPNVLRFFDHMRFEIYAADENLTTYINLQTPSGTISQNRPEFTNINNGAGIFASRIKLTLDDVLLQDAGNPSFDDKLVLMESVCGKRFATIEPSTADTCICDDVPASADNGLLCPYDKFN